MVVHGARGRAPGLAGVILRYVPAGADEANWDLAGIEFGTADHDQARRAVAEAVAAYRLHWIMVPDGDPRDEQVVGPLTAEELSRLRARTPRDP